MARDGVEHRFGKGEAVGDRLDDLRADGDVLAIADIVLFAHADIGEHG